MLTVTYHNVVKVKYTTMKMMTMMTTAHTMTMTTQQIITSCPYVLPQHAEG